MELYHYNGPVFRFDQCVADHWKAETLASSEKKARSNLIYQFKQTMGLEPRTTIKLTGKIVKEDQKNNG